MQRDCEARGCVTVLSIQHPLLEAHVRSHQTPYYCAHHSWHVHSVRQTFLCAHHLYAQTHAASKGRVRISNTAPAGGQFVGQDEVEIEESE